MARQEEIKGTIDDRDVRIVVSEATVLSSYMRVIYRNKAEEELKERFGEVSTARQQAALMAGMYTYPKLMSVTVEADGLDVENMTIDDFLGLPVPLADAWLSAVYRLNPNFAAAPGEATDATDDEREDAEKKGGKSGEKPG